MSQSKDRYRHAIYALLLAWAALLTPGKPALAVEPVAGPPSSLSLPEQELTLKRQEFDLKRQEFDFKQKEAASLQELEMWKTYGSIGSVIIAALALAIPVWIAAINVRAQRKVSDEQAKLTFQMKVADLALMNAENATQAREKARALASLFGPSPLLPEQFAERFDPQQFKLDFGRSTKTREQMLTLLAQYPGQRDQILKDWYVLFRWDWWWVQPLLSLNADEKRRLDEIRNHLQANENEVNKQASIAQMARSGVQDST